MPTVNNKYNPRSDPESSLIAVGYASSLITVYNIPESRILSTLTCEEGATNESVNSLASHPTNGTIIAGYNDKEIRIFDVSSGKSRSNCNCSVITCLQYTARNARLQTGAAQTPGFSIVTVMVTYLATLILIPLKFSKLVNCFVWYAAFCH